MSRPRSEPIGACRSARVRPSPPSRASILLFITFDAENESYNHEYDHRTLEGVVASEEMVTYICQYHESTQVGDITVETQ